MVQPYGGRYAVGFRLSPQAAVHGDGLAGYIGGAGAEEEDNLGIVPGITGALQRHGLHSTFEEVFVEAAFPLRVDNTRRDGVDPDIGRQTAGELTGQVDKPGLGAGIGRA